MPNMFFMFCGVLTEKFFLNLGITWGIKHGISMWLVVRKVPTAIQHLWVGKHALVCNLTSFPGKILAWCPYGLSKFQTLHATSDLHVNILKLYPLQLTAITFCIDRSCTDNRRVLDS